MSAESMDQGLPGNQQHHAHVHQQFLLVNLITVNCGPSGDTVCYYTNLASGTRYT